MKGKTLIIGIGNPGKEYGNTYHNAGILFVDYFADKLGISFKTHESFSYASRGELILAKSLVFMNESGAAVQAAANYFKIEPSHLYVAHDESDLPVGEYKIEAGRGAAGHRGVLSAIERLGANEFNRIRIGIRDEDAPTKRREKASEFVLRKINSEHKKKMEDSFGLITASLSELSAEAR